MGRIVYTMGWLDVVLNGTGRNEWVVELKLGMKNGLLYYNIGSQFSFNQQMELRLQLRSDDGPILQDRQGQKRMAVVRNFSLCSPQLVMESHIRSLKHFLEQI